MRHNTIALRSHLCGSRVPKEAFWNYPCGILGSFVLKCWNSPLLEPPTYLTYVYSLLHSSVVNWNHNHKLLLKSFLWDNFFFVYYVLKFLFWQLITLGYNGFCGLIISICIFAFSNSNLSVNGNFCHIFFHSVYYSGCSQFIQQSHLNLYPHTSNSIESMKLTIPQEIF